MAHVFTSLRYPAEKLLEAEHFLGGMTRSSGLTFQFELNAFLSACRSVSFYLQKSLSEVPGFENWYSVQQESMRTDPAMRFFLDLRNVSQKQGPVSFVGGSLPGGGWTYRFLGNLQAVPPELVGTDISAGSATHLAKLAQLLLECSREFPFQSCPARALTVEGMAALGYGWVDVEVALGFPPGYTQVGEFPAEDRLRYLSREVEPLDIEAIQRIASRDIRIDGEPVTLHASSGSDLVDHIASTACQQSGDAAGSRDIFLRAILQWIDDFERRR